MGFNESGSFHYIFISK